MKALVQRVYESARRTLFRQHASGQALKCPADIDRVHDLLRGEGPYNEAARIQLGEYAFLGKNWQRLANRRSRDPELRCQLDLTDTLSRRELAVQNHLANS